MFSENPTKLGLPSIHTDYWEPVFAACSDAGLVISMHVGSSPGGADRLIARSTGVEHMWVNGVLTRQAGEGIPGVAAGRVLRSAALS